MDMNEFSIERKTFRENKKKKNFQKSGKFIAIKIKRVLKQENR